jgi:transaldolase
MTGNRFIELRSYGQSIWIDFISRDALASGELKGLVTEGILGLTSNPAIFEQAIAKGRTYDADITRMAAAGAGVEEVYETLALADIQAAADLLRPVYDQTEALDGYVSLEVSPRLAHDTDGTIANAHRLWVAAARPNLMIKVPGTPEGIPAIRALIAAGINVNVTLLFARKAYEDAANAYIEGLEERAAAGLAVDRIASVASFFVSRLDTAVDAWLADRPEVERLRGKAGIANTRLAYARFQQIFAGPRWEKLAARGARVQRPLWASTSAKDPRYPDTIYVDELIGPHTVNTAPPQTVAAFRDHGKVSETVTQDVEGARAALAALTAAGLDMDQVTDDLLRAGLQAFTTAFDRLESGLGAKIAAVQQSQIAQ